MYVCDTQLLIMLDDGNKYAANKFKSQHGLKQVASAFGIIGWIHTHPHTYIQHTHTKHTLCVCLYFTGFLRFLEGYYIVLITKRKP